MKTINDINNEIQTLERDLEAKRKLGIKHSQLQRIGPKIAELRIFKTYLESNPSEEYLQKEQSRISRLLQICDERFAQRLSDAFPNVEPPNSIRSQMQSEHNKQYDIARLKGQLKTLNYLLA